MSRTYTPTGRPVGRPRESEKLIVSGKLTGYGKGDKYGDGKVKYSVQLELSPEVLAQLRERVRPWFKDTDPKFTPKWVNGEDGKVVFRSSYDIAYGWRKDGVDCQVNGKPFSYISKIPEDFGDIKGSTVDVALTIKPGAIYPTAMRVTDLNCKGLEDFFGGAV